MCGPTLVRRTCRVSNHSKLPRSEGTQGHQLWKPSRNPKIQVYFRWYISGELVNLCVFSIAGWFLVCHCYPFWSPSDIRGACLKPPKNRGFDSGGHQQVQRGAFFGGGFVEGRRWVWDVSKRTRTHPCFAYPRPPQTPNERNSFINCWFWVWGMLENS